MPLPPAWIVFFEAFALKTAEHREPASAPNRLAEMTLPLRAAMLSMSKATRRCEACAGNVEHFGGIGDAVARRHLLAHRIGAMRQRRSSVVRSGVTSPRMMARPASMSSAAMTISTSPGAGISERPGCGQSPGRVQDSKWWRRCAGRRQAPTSPAHTSRCLRQDARSSRQARRRPARQWPGWRF